MFPQQWQQGQRMVIYGAIFLVMTLLILYSSNSSADLQLLQNQRVSPHRQTHQPQEMGRDGGIRSCLRQQGAAKTFTHYSFNPSSSKKKYIYRVRERERERERDRVRECERERERKRERRERERERVRERECESERRERE